MLGVPKGAGHLLGISKVDPYIPMDWNWQITIYSKPIAVYKLVKLDTFNQGVYREETHWAC